MIQIDNASKDNALRHEAVFTEKSLCFIQLSILLTIGRPNGSLIKFP